MASLMEIYYHFCMQVKKSPKLLFKLKIIFFLPFDSQAVIDSHTIL